MIRTLQVCGVHAWVSMRLTMSRGYWLPRLSLALIAGYMLFFFSLYYEPNGWGPVATSIVVGASCISLCRSDLSSRQLPLPLPPGHITTVGVLVQVLLCVIIAFGYMLADVATAYTIMFGLDGVSIWKQPIPGLLTPTELAAMGIMVLASLPVGLALVAFLNHVQRPHNAWANRPWASVLIPLCGFTACSMLALHGATLLEAPAFALKYLQAWKSAAWFLTSTAVALYAWTAIVPQSHSKTRPARSAPTRLAITIGQSVLVKTVLVAIGLVLYLIPPSVYLPDGWPMRLGQKARPLFVCYAALFPFLSIHLLTDTRSTSGGEQHIGWRWVRSGWRIVPAPRGLIQRALLVDTLGFYAAVTLGLHLLVSAIDTTEGGAHSGVMWASDMYRFAWLFTMFASMALPAFILFFIPRRRFGLFTASAAFVATLWLIVATLYGFGSDVAWTLSLKQHTVTLVCWVLLGAAVWGQAGSVSGRLFEPGEFSSRLFSGMSWAVNSRRLHALLLSATLLGFATLIAVHRSMIDSQIAEVESTRITAEQTDRLVRDLKTLRDQPWLPSMGRTRNAAAILDRHIGIDDGTPAMDVAWWDDPKHMKTLNYRDQKRWFDAPADVEIGDLSILTALTEYDHWETGHPPNTEAGGSAPQSAYQSHLTSVPHRTYLNHFEPLPNLAALFNLVKFRLLHGLRSGDVLPALREVRHLARLIHSDETMINTAVAIGILRHERRAYAAAVQRGLIAPTDWDPVPLEDINAMKRAVVSLSFIAAGGATEDHWRRVAELDFEPFGLCGALHEGVASVLTQPQSTHWPGERSLSIETNFIDHGLSTSQCSVPLARHDHRRLKSGATLRNAEWQHELARELDRATLLALSLPYIRGPAWMETPFGSQPYGVLFYGETAEDDWNGYRVVHAGGERSRPESSE